MRCQYAKSLLPVYTDSMLPDEQKIGLERHLSSCDVCQRELEDYKRLFTIMRGMDELEAPPEFMTQMRERLSLEKRAPLPSYNRWNPVRQRAKWFVAAAASVALIAGMYISSLVPLPMVAEFLGKDSGEVSPNPGGLSSSIEEFLQVKQQQMQLALQGITGNKEEPAPQTVTHPVVTAPGQEPLQVTEVPEQQVAVTVAPSAEKRVINTVAVSTTTPDVDGVVDSLTQLAASYDARVEAGSSQLMSGVSRVVVIRVSPDKADDMLADLKSMGIQNQPRQGTDNVSGEYNNLRDRMGEVEAEITRLQSSTDLDADEQSKLKAMQFEKVHLQDKLNDIDQNSKLVAVSVTITGEINP